MAAGMGSRYGSLKQIDSFGPSGETIVDYSVYDAIRAGFGRVVFILRKDIVSDFQETFQRKFGDKITVDYVLQELDNLPTGITAPPDRQKPWGTGHAVWVAADVIQEPFAVINADDFYGAQSFQRVADFLTSVDAASNEHCLIGYRLRNTLSEHGHVSRGICEVSDEGLLEKVTERTQIYTNADGQIVYQEDGAEHSLTGEETASMNLVGFAPSAFAAFEQGLKNFLETKREHPKAEFYLPDVVNYLCHSPEASVKVITTPESWFGVTYQQDKALAQQKLQSLVEQGVYPKNLWG